MSSLSVLRVDPNGIELPDSAWDQEGLLACLEAASKFVATEDVPAVAEDALL